MNILSGGQADFFGLDLGSTSLRVVQLKGSGPVKALDKYGYRPTEGNMTISDAESDHTKVGKAVQELVKQVGITSRNVAANLPSTKVFTTVIEMDRMPPEDLGKTILYQAESFIPTPLAQSKVDWTLIGDSPSNPKKVEVLLSSVANTYIEARLHMLEAAGFNVVAFEPDGMALARAIIPFDATTAQMVLDIGNSATDLVIAMAGNPHLTRSIPIGTGAFVKAATDNLGIEAEQAQQFIFKFGLAKDKLEGQIYNAVLSTVENLMVEIEKSIKFFQSRYPNSKLERIIVTGGASSMPELPLFIANRFSLNVEVGNAWRNVSFPSSMQNELLAISNHFAVAVGLAERVV